MKIVEQNLKFPLEPPVILNFDINNACRICLVNKSLVSIYDDKYSVNNVSLAELLKECSNYEVKQHDDYPQQICKQCIENVRVAYIFRKQCEISHKLINTIVKSNKDKDLEDTSTQTSAKLSNSCGDCDRRLKTIKEKNHEPKSRKGHITYTDKVKKPVNLVRTTRNIAKKCGKLYNTNQTNLDVSSSIEDMNEKISSSNSDEERFDMPEIVENASKIQKMLMKTCQEMIKSNKVYKNNLCSNKNSTTNEKSYYRFNCENDKFNNSAYRYECTDCKMKFLTPNEFQKHMKICKTELTTKSNKVKSDKIISTVSSCKSNKTSSIISKKKLKKFHEYCKLCNKLFTNINTYRNHIKIHENPLIYSCLYCTKKYLKPQNLTLHIERYHPEKSTLIKQYKTCYLCKKIYKSKELIEKSPLKKLDNKCSRCKAIDMNVNSSNANSKMNGIASNIRRKKNICNICNQEFSDLTILKTHQKTHTSKSLHQCSNCTFKCDTRTELLAHLKAHNLDKLQTCTKCSKQYSKLKRHSCQPSSSLSSSVTHDVIYTCKYCGKIFNRASNLITHESSHGDDKKPHICATCGKGFNRSYNLVLHMRTHLPEKQYKCILCQKKFAYSNELKTHMLSHTEERYLCEYCNESFLQKVNLIQHQRNVHGIKNSRASCI